jgi:hypothetical protein
MGASAKEFLLMRMEEETGQMFVPVMTKKQIESKAEMDVLNICDEGELYLDDVLIDATRISHYLAAFTKVLRTKISASEVRSELKGAKLSFRSTGSKLNYEEDAEWQRLKNLLDERQELLKMAEKSSENVYDSKKNVVPKVSRNGGGESIVISY